MHSHEIYGGTTVPLDNEGWVAKRKYCNSCQELHSHTCIELYHGKIQLL